METIGFFRQTFTFSQIQISWRLNMPTKGLSVTNINMIELLQILKQNNSYLILCPLKIL